MINIRQRRLMEFLQANNEQLHELMNDQDSALTELAEIITEDEANHEDLETAVIELAEIVGGGNID